MKLKKKHQKAVFVSFLCGNDYLFRPFFNALTIGMNTKAPEMSIVRISMPSICGLEVRTIKQSAAQNKASTTHCEVVRGLRMMVGLLY